jgi:RNA polymerase sigma-70 factor (family 1)
MPADRDLYTLFETIFREHYEALAGYAFSILRSKENAEDVVQDVFIRIWKNTPQVIETSQVKYYLLTAVKNSCISFLRKQANKAHVQPEDAQLHTLPDEPVAIKETRKDSQAMISEAFSLLPPQCLVVFKMSRFGKLTYQQIADELNISIKTVENQVGKALRIMREYAKQNNLSFTLILSLLAADWLWLL